MQLLALPLLCLVAVATAAPQTEKRIVGGENAELYSHPYIASVQFRGRHSCGGVIISEWWILTAAHCVLKKDRLNDVYVAKKKEDLSVVVGALHLDNKTQYQQTSQVFEYIIHDDYDLDTVDNDIAVLRLAKPIVLNKNVAVVEMAPKGSSFLNTGCVISGWGMINGSDKGSAARHLQEVVITQISNSECRKTWNVGPGHICVLDENPTSSCMGDSGGPMMCGPNREFLAGLTSYGDEFCTHTRPSVYTRVSYYLDWIKSVTEYVADNESKLCKYLFPKINGHPKYARACHWLLRGFGYIDRFNPRTL